MFVLLFNLAPILIATPALLVFAVIPFGIGTYVADLNVGVLFIMAVTSLTTLAVLTAAWSSANRIAILSALRSVALLISYEIPMALALVGVIMLFLDSNRLCHGDWSWVLEGLGAQLVT